MALRSLILDFNSYFASVEQQEQPRLRGKPIVVAPVEAETTCCIAASYEAKRFGVKTGTRISEARKMCPGLIVVQGRGRLYVQYHKRLVEIVESCTHVENVMSIDEMACELTGELQKKKNAVALAHSIKQKIAREVGPFLKSSIGIAPNSFLAKVASDMQKPDGLTVLELSDLPQRLYGLQLRDFCGIGPNMEARLHHHGIYTAATFVTASKEQLRKAWGSIEGERMHARLRGELLDEEPTQRRVVGHSHVLPPQERHAQGALSVLHDLLQKAGVRLRRMGYLASRLEVYVKSMRQPTWHVQMRFRETADTLHFIRILNHLWEGFPEGHAPFLVGVNLAGLVSKTDFTPDLFGEEKIRDGLNTAIDRLNERFGKNTVFYAGAWPEPEPPPVRIAFSHVPAIEKTRTTSKEGKTARRFQAKAIPPPPRHPGKLPKVDVP